MFEDLCSFLGLSKESFDELARDCKNDDFSHVLAMAKQRIEARIVDQLITVDNETEIQSIINELKTNFGWSEDGRVI